MSEIEMKLIELISRPLRRALKHCLPAPPPARDRGVKYAAELAFWDGWVREQGAEPDTEYYKAFMMNMGGIENQAFFDGLICLDIGCGPKGSLTWLTNARAGIGIDPLANEYMRFGIDRHDMIYLSCQAEHLPLPNHYADVVFSMNSLDHVDDVRAVCKEIRRVLKPGGYFIGSLNLYEPVTATEPVTLTESFLDKHLFRDWERQHYRIRPKANCGGHFGPYRYFFEECPEELIGKPGAQALWCRFKAGPPAENTR